MTYLETASSHMRDAESAAQHPSALLLLLARGQRLEEFIADYVEAALMDLQVLMNHAWDAGEVGPMGEQLAMAWGVGNGRKKAA